MNDEIDLPSLAILSTKLNDDLQGKQGTNRDKHNFPQIRANNDYEALQCWLKEYSHKSTTFRTYQKESERFLLWAIFQKQKPLSSLDRDNLEEYLTFLDDPQPKEKWCAKLGGRRCKRGSPNWRPFTGPLSTAAKMTAVSSIDSMLNYLVHARYLSFNPLSLIRKRYTANKRININHLLLPERLLTTDEWHAMLDTLDEMTEVTTKQKKEKERLIFLIKMLYFLGLRINELIMHCWNAFRKIDNQWWFYVMGKGDKLARIPVNDELLRAVITYRAYLKKSPYPEHDDTGPLIESFTTKKAITSRQVNKLLKQLALKTAEKFLSKPDVVKKLKKFSAHWLRHLSASMQDQAGISFKHIRGNLRHENDETTRRYVHAIDGERHQDMQKLKLRILNE